MNVFRNIILLHVLKDEFDIAIEKCNRRIILFSDRPELAAYVYNLKGGLYLSRKELSLAEKAFAKAISLSPDFLKPYYSLARLYLIKKDENKAIAQYQTILEKQSDQTAPHMMLGTIYSLQKKFDLSEKHYREALSINPDFTPAANNLAYLLAEQGRNYDEALTLVLKADKQKPDDPFIKDTLGWIYYRMGEYDKAVQLLTESTEKIPDNAILHYHLGMALFKKGETQLAKRHFEKALKLNNNFSEADEVRKILSTLP
jgi:tetratricopeptide (TPR) repeat protein